jgi:Tol biopolymer transport system component
MQSTNTRETRQLTDHPSNDYDPGFSHDGKQLIWSAERSGNFETWMMNLDGTNARQISRDNVDAQNPTATPDGDLVVYNSRHGDKFGLWKIRADGTGAIRLIEGELLWPQISPDGRYVSYAIVLGKCLTAIRVVRIADGQQVAFEIRLEAREFPNGRSRWLPDGSAIAFNWQAPGAPGIYAKTYSGSTQRSAVRWCNSNDRDRRVLHLPDGRDLPARIHRTEHHRIEAETSQHRATVTTARARRPAPAAQDDKLVRRRRDQLLDQRIGGRRRCRVRSTAGSKTSAK